MHILTTEQTRQIHGAGSAVNTTLVGMQPGVPLPVPLPIPLPIHSPTGPLRPFPSARTSDPVTP